MTNLPNLDPTYSVPYIRKDAEGHPIVNADVLIAYIRTCPDMLAQMEVFFKSQEAGDYLQKIKSRRLAGVYVDTDDITFPGAAVTDTHVSGDEMTFLSNMFSDLNVNSYKLQDFFFEYLT